MESHFDCPSLFVANKFNSYSVVFNISFTNVIKLLVVFNSIDNINSIQLSLLRLIAEQLLSVDSVPIWIRFHAI